MANQEPLDISRESDPAPCSQVETPLLVESLSIEPSPVTWYSKVKESLSPQEWTGVIFLTLAVLGLHVIGWGTLVLLVVPKHYKIGESQTFGIALGVTAYTLGMRHAFDADHIAAIDSTTRKFMAEGKRPLSVGFWFALGHSSVVFFAAVLIAFGLKSFAGQVEDDASQLHHITGLIGALVSGTFLYIIGLLNLVILIDIIKVFREMRTGGLSERDLEEMLDRRGFMNRFLSRLAAAIREPWHMYPLGFLFGLGFDTATEVALLFLAAGAALSGLPWFAILCLPVLFAAGMTLLDTLDGSFMNFAYGWAFSKPVRKVYYNIVITGLSVAVALIIGTIELLQVLIDKAGWSGAFWDWWANIDLNVIGFVIVGLFVFIWVVALAVWHFGRIEERWSQKFLEDDRCP